MSDPTFIKKHVLLVSAPSVLMLISESIGIQLLINNFGYCNLTAK